MSKEVVTLPGLDRALRKAKVPLSPAIKANGFVFVSGTPPLDPKTGKMVRGDIEQQTKRVMENLKAILDAAGTSMSKVVKVTIFISNAAYYDTVNRIYARYFRTAPPARTFATVGSWPWAFDIEIECIALAR